MILFLVFPPIFVQLGAVEGNSGSGRVLELSYGLQTYALAFVAGLLYFFYRSDFYSEWKKGSRFERFFVCSSVSMLGFGFLVLVYAFLVVIQRWTPFFSDATFSKVHFDFSFSGIAGVFFGSLASVFYEEIVYRFYLPEAFLRIHFFETFRLRKIALEALCVILFAIPHLYLGVPGLLNAFFCGIVLRVCFIRSKTIFVPLLIHFLYNISMIVAGSMM